MAVQQRTQGKSRTQIVRELLAELGPDTPTNVARSQLLRRFGIKVSDTVIYTERRDLKLRKEEQQKAASPVPPTPKPPVPPPPPPTPTPRTVPLPNPEPHTKNVEEAMSLLESFGPNLNGLIDIVTKYGDDKIFALLVLARRLGNWSQVRNLADLAQKLK